MKMKYIKYSLNKLKPLAGLRNTHMARSFCKYIKFSSFAFGSFVIISVYLIKRFGLFGLTFNYLLEQCGVNPDNLEYFTLGYILMALIFFIEELCNSPFHNTLSNPSTPSDHSLSEINKPNLKSNNGETTSGVDSTLGEETLSVAENSNTSVEPVSNEDNNLSNANVESEDNENNSSAGPNDHIPYPLPTSSDIIVHPYVFQVRPEEIPAEHKKKVIEELQGERDIFKDEARSMIDGVIDGTSLDPESDFFDSQNAESLVPEVTERIREIRHLLNEDKRRGDIDNASDTESTVSSYSDEDD